MVNMAKTEEKIEFYIAEMEKLGISFEKDLFTKVVKGLGPSIFKKDAEVVACSDESELETVKKNFLIKKHGLEKGEAIDAAVKAVCEKMGSSNKNKYRAIFYYILVEDLKLAGNYADDTKKADAPVAAEEAKVEAPAKEEAKVEAPAKEEAKVEAVPVTEEAKAEPAKEEAPKYIPEPETPHDEFDWTIDKRNVNFYSQEEIDAMEGLYTASLKTLNDNSIVKGVVASITKTDVVLNVGFKSDGLISKSEFRDMPDLTVGDEVEVYVVTTENHKGQLELSRKKAKLLVAWENIKKAYEEGTIVKGTVLSKTKGGLIVDVTGLETFLPGSQIDVKPIIDYDIYVGKTMEFKIVKINETIKNAVVSHKALIESDMEEQRQVIISKMEKGQVLEGVIKNITDFGAFIDLGGVDGLLYITDISWGRINHPKDVLELNQKLNVVVLEFDEAKKRISLGLKQLHPHPWEESSEGLEIGQKVKGKVVNVEDYGAFVEVKPGVEGLVHVSEVTWSNEPVNSRDFFKLGEEVEAIIMTLDKEDRKMSLSVKQLTQDPWMVIAEKFPVGSKHLGKVKNIAPYGVFVELAEGIGGMVHISDLSWTKRYGHPSELVNKDQDLDVVVLDIDSENRKLSLGHKHIEEDPWDTFENVFPEGSVHEATVLKVEDKGAIILMPYGLEAFAPTRHIKKEDGNNAKVDDTLPFKVLEFNRNDKRIIVSHTKIIDANMAEEKAVKSKKAKSDRANSNKAVKNIQSNVAKSTLGDMDVLAELKKKMQGGK
ncbi:MAG: small subunit ribosomal protein S1 [Planctomycetota bacterium]|jgi:small subunit ribosomal protein S1